MKQTITNRWGTTFVTAAVGAACGGLLAWFCAQFIDSSVTDTALALAGATVGACCTVE